MEDVRQYGSVLFAREFQVVEGGVVAVLVADDEDAPAVLGDPWAGVDDAVVCPVAEFLFKEEFDGAVGAPLVVVEDMRDVLQQEGPGAVGG